MMCFDAQYHRLKMVQIGEDTQLGQNLLIPNQMLYYEAHMSQDDLFGSVLA